MACTPRSCELVAPWKLAQEELVQGLLEMGHVERVCEVCQARKQRHTSFPEQAKYRARELLDLVHGNLCGPIAPATSGGNKYFLLLVDDLSRYMWVVAIPSKDYAMAAIKEIQVRAEGESGCMLRALHVDRGGKFTFMEFIEYCMMEAVQSQHTAPHIPQQNNMMEHRNVRVVATVRSMLKVKGLLLIFLMLK